jgi:hypothetical protein
MIDLQEPWPNEMYPGRGSPAQAFSRETLKAGPGTISAVRDVACLGPSHAGSPQSRRKVWLDTAVWTLSISIRN